MDNDGTVEGYATENYGTTTTQNFQEFESVAFYRYPTAPPSLSNDPKVQVGLPSPTVRPPSSKKTLSAAHTMEGMHLFVTLFLLMAAPFFLQLNNLVIWSITFFIYQVSLETINTSFPFSPTGT